MSPLNGTVKMSPMMTRGDVFMKTKEARRLVLIEQASAGKVSVREVSERLGLSCRQVIRLKGRFREEGASGLIHKGRGKPSGRRIPQGIRDFVAVKAKGDFAGASCQHMAELFAAEHGLTLSAKTIGRILREEGAPCPHTHRSPKGRRKRERRARRGDLLQMDASPFDWFGDGVMRWLHGAIDDATGRVAGLWMADSECLSGYLRVLRTVLEKQGVPRELYADRHTIFVSPKTDKLTPEEELKGITVRKTQFGRVLETLGVRFIAARSPQAKGRIERLWGTLQSRLVVAFRLAGISAPEAANAFLATYPEREHNPRFAVEPGEGESAFLPVPDTTDLDLLLASHEGRKASGDSTISFEGQKYCLRDTRSRMKLLVRGKAVTVVKKLDGDLVALVDGKAFALVPVMSPSAGKPSAGKPTETGNRRRIPHKPAANHPWRKRFLSASPSTRTPRTPGQAPEFA